MSRHARCHSRPDTALHRVRFRTRRETVDFAKRDQAIRCQNHFRKITGTPSSGITTCTQSWKRRIIILTGGTRVPQ